jgi:hypothetical protein
MWPVVIRSRSVDAGALRVALQRSRHTIE